MNKNKRFGREREGRDFSGVSNFCFRCRILFRMTDCFGIWRNIEKACTKILTKLWVYAKACFSLRTPILYILEEDT